MTGSRDPTRSQGLRRNGRAVVNRKVFELHRQFRETLQERDLVGLRQRDVVPSTFIGFVESSSNRVDRSEVMVRQIVQHVLDSDWLHELIRRAVQKGVEQVGQELRVDIADIDASDVAMFQSAAATVEVDGIAGETVRRVMRGVVMAIESQWRPELLMRELRVMLEKITRRRLALLVNTSVVRAVNGGKLYGYRANGIKQVGIDPEWLPHIHSRDSVVLLHDKVVAKKHKTQRLSAGQQRRREARERKMERELGGGVEVLTAEDDRVCQECEDISAGGPYDLDEARGLIPAHVNCRCAFVPVGDERFAEIEHDE